VPPHFWWKSMIKKMTDDDYASIQRPAFAVEGEPDLEAHILKVKVAKLDRSRVNKDNIVYIP